MPKELTMSVSKGALRTAPKMFDSVEHLLREALQNSYRAGATHVDVTLDDDSPKFEFLDGTMRKLTIQDNGLGIENPADFFTLGRNGWRSEETGVSPKDPAGWGAFSYVMVGVDLVRVTSHHKEGTWIAEYGPRHLDGVTPINMQYMAPIGVGTTIEIWFGDGKTRCWPRKYAIERFQDIRWNYPMEITYNGTVVESPVDLSHWRTARSYWGTLRWTKKDTHLSNAVEWEYTKVHSSTLTDQMRKIGDNDHRLRAAYDYLNTYSWYFVVNPDSGIMPDLPARKYLIKNPELQSAAAWILDIMWGMLWDRIDTKVKALPDTVSLENNVAFAEARVPRLLRELSAGNLKTGHSLVDNVMRFAGYTRYEILDTLPHAYRESISWNAGDGAWHYGGGYVPESVVYYSKVKHYKVHPSIARTIMALKMDGDDTLPLVTASNIDHEAKISLGQWERSQNIMFLDRDIRLTIDENRYTLPWLLWDTDFQSWDFVAFGWGDMRDVWEEIVAEDEPMLLFSGTPERFNVFTKDEPLWAFPLHIQLAEDGRLDVEAGYAIHEEWSAGEVSAAHFSEQNFLNMLRTEALTLLGMFDENDLEHINEFTANMDALQQFAQKYIDDMALAAARMSGASALYDIKKYTDELECAWINLKKAQKTFENSLK